MSAGRFNLVDEAWIPVEDSSGEALLVSLSGAFEHSHEITRIGGEIPTQSFAILGLLSAILRRVMVRTWGPAATNVETQLHQPAKPWGIKEWAQAWQGREEVVEVVLDYLEEFHDRFDLRDPEQPFYQVADLRTSKGEHSGLEVLLADVPNGEPFFTTRLREGNREISWAEAARWLVHVQAFDPSGIRSGAVGDPRVKGGKGYPTGAGWAAQIGGLVVERDTLWDTLLTNLVPDGVGNLHFEEGADLPPWERPQLTEKEEVEGGRDPRGPVDLATWQARRVRLVGTDAGVVGVVLCQGDRVTPQFRQHLEPRTAWRYSDPQTKKAGTTVYMPQELDPARSLWQGLEALLPGTSSFDPRVKTAEVLRQVPPALSGWLEDLIEHGHLSAQDIRYHATGVKLGSNNSVIVELIDDSVVLPAAVFAPGQDTLRNRVVHAARLAQDLARELGYYAGNLAKAAGADATDGEESRAREQMIAAAGPEFQRWLVDVTPETLERDEAEWSHRLWSLSEEEARVLISAAPPEAFEGRKTSRGEIDAGLAEVYFRARRHKLGVARRKTQADGTAVADTPDTNGESMSTGTPESAADAAIDQGEEGDLHE